MNLLSVLNLHFQFFSHGQVFSCIQNLNSIFIVANFVYDKADYLATPIMIIICFNTIHLI